VDNNEDQQNETEEKGCLYFSVVYAQLAA